MNKPTHIAAAANTRFPGKLQRLKLVDPHGVSDFVIPEPPNLPRTSEIALWMRAWRSNDNRDGLAAVEREFPFEIHGQCRNTTPDGARRCAVSAQSDDPTVQPWAELSYSGWVAYKRSSIR
jgi:hypothetical protein